MLAFHALRLLMMGLFLGALLAAPPAKAAERMGGPSMGGGMGSDAPAAKKGGRRELSHLSAKECERCHQAIYKEWAKSMHAHSSALENPIHGGCYNNLVGDGRSEGQLHKFTKDYPLCLYCHAPNAATNKTTKLDDRPSYREGVNCMVCHRMEELVGGFDEKDEPHRGIAAYKTSKVLQGANGFGRDARTRSLALDDEATNPHVPAKDPAADPEGLSAPMYLEANPKLFKGSDMCLGCHQQRRNMYGVPILHAEPDFMLGIMKGATCQSCHMPAVNGHISHAFAGGRDPAMLRKAATMEVTTERKGEAIKASVLLVNRLPHKLPTGAPFRAMSLRISAHDAKGKKLWQNFDKAPREEDPKAYLWYPMLDKEGKPTMPPIAYKPGPDKRLLPYEKRTIDFTLPGKDVAFIQAELRYHVLTPEMQNNLKEKARHVKRPRTMVFSEVRVE